MNKKKKKFLNPLFSFFFRREFMECTTAVKVQLKERCMHAHVATTHLALEKLVSDKDTELVVFS
jgi:hypothetical protein